MRNYKKLQDNIKNESTDLDWKIIQRSYMTNVGNHDQRWIIKSTDLKPGDVIVSFFGIPVVVTDIDRSGIYYDIKGTIERDWNETYPKGKKVESQLQQTFVMVFKPMSV